MRLLIYEGAGLLLMALSLYFFYHSIDFLTANEYVGAVISMLIGFMMIRSGVDLSKIAMLSGNERRSK